jgi:hypothetical protein
MPKKKVPEVDLVLKELADLRYKSGYSRKSLLAHLEERYDIGWSRGYELISMMMKELSEAYHKTNQDALADSINFLDDLKQAALTAGDNKLALEITKEINKVSQLYVQKLEIDAKIELPLFGPPKEDEKKI